MAVINLLLGVVKVWVLCLFFANNSDRIGRVNIEFIVRDESQVIPQHALEIGGAFLLRKDAAHNLNNGLGTLLPFLAIGNSEGIVYHFLYVASVFGQSELRSCSIVIHRIILCFL